MVEAMVIALIAEVKADIQHIQAQIQQLRKNIGGPQWAQQSQEIHTAMEVLRVKYRFLKDLFVHLKTKSDKTEAMELMNLNSELQYQVSFLDYRLGNELEANVVFKK